jgi:hypothetical protein
MHRIHCLKLGGGWLCHSLCLTFDIMYAVADAASQRILNMAFRACLRYIRSLRRLNHVYQLDTSVSLYVILHELAEGSSKCFKFHYLVSQSILLDTYFLFLPKKFLCRFVAY